MTHAAITIGVPAHNEEKRIARFLTDLVRNLRSFSERNHPVEIIVVANGCVDQTEAVVEDFARQQGIFFQRVTISAETHAPDVKLGLVLKLLATDVKSKSHAWNQIYDLATSEVIFFFDADVRLEDDTVKILHEHLLRSPDLFAVAADVQPARSSASLFHLYLVFQEKIARSHCRQKISGAGYAIRKDKRMVTQLPENLIGDDAYLTTLIAVTDASPYRPGIDKLLRDPKAVVWHSPAKSMMAFYRGTLRAHCGTRQNDQIWGNHHKAIKDRIRDVRSRQEKMRCLNNREKICWFFLKLVFAPIAKLLVKRAKRKAEAHVSDTSMETYSVWSTKR